MSKVIQHSFKRGMSFDERGWNLKSLFYLEKFIGERIKDFHLVYSEPGRVRANHLHKIQKEWLFVFGGRALFVWKDARGRLRKKKINEKDYILFEIWPNTPHALKNTSRKGVYVLALTNRRYNPKNPDKVDVKLL